MNRQSNTWSTEHLGKPSDRAWQQRPREHENQPPHSVDAEQGVLSSMMQQSGGLEATAQIIAEIGADYFYVPAHREVFTVISDHYNSGKPTHHAALTITLCDRQLLTQIGGVGTLAQLQTFVPTAANFAYYLDIVRNKYMLREAFAAADQIKLRVQSPEAKEEGGTLKILDEAQCKFASIESLDGRYGATAGKSLTDFAEMDPADLEKANLLGRRWLCICGVALFVGPTGIGKSAAGVQQDILWALGREAFGIKPARPLRILCVQAENDEGDMHEMALGVMKQLSLTETDREQVRRDTIYIEERGSTGPEFLHLLRKAIRLHKPDIVRIDPLHAYAGGDLRDSAVTTAFFRNGLNSILKKFLCAAIINHHTTKTVYHDPSKWTPDDWAYAGAGGAEIANFPRATLAIQSTNISGIYKFHAGKRWTRIGWVDESGNPTNERVFCWHSQGNIFWRPADETDLLRIQSAERKTKGGKTEDDLFNIIPPDNTPIRQNELLARAQKADIGRNTARGMLQILISDGRAYQWFIPRPRTRPEIHVARIPQPEPELEMPKT